MHTNNTKLIICVKFSENGLIPLPILRKIEEMYDNDQLKLQNAFNSYDACSAIGK